MPDAENGAAIACGACDCRMGCGADAEWRSGRLIDPAVTENLCVHSVGLTPGLWCGACNTHPKHPDLTRVTPPEVGNR